jgi:glycosyltransferase involved in cell wall biosynthesis
VDISVVIPTRNRSHLLPVTVRSVMQQQNVDFELIVVDEASTDDTAAVLDGLSDPRLRVIHHQAVCGVSAARNDGAALARGGWIAFLDDDDLWAPNKLELQLGAVRETGASWGYVGHLHINVHSQVTSGASPPTPDVVVRELPRENLVPGGCSGVMVSKSAFEAAGKFDPRLQPLADWELWLRLARHGVPACVPQPLVAYRVHGEQMSLDAARVLSDFEILAQRHPDADPIGVYRYLAWVALRVKDHRRALKFFLRGWLGTRTKHRVSPLVSDLSALGRDVAEHRLGLTWGTSPPISDEIQSWRRAGQAWVDALVNASETDGDNTVWPPTQR